jgi:lipopolysaccharide export system protein LptA
MSPFKTILGLALLLCCLTASANMTDRQQPITVDSDFAERDEKTGLTVYRGNVVARQGSLLIEGDVITIVYENNRVIRILCVGLPAHFEQETSTKGEMVTAYGESIEYLPIAEKIKLEKNASISQKGTLVKGDVIDYDLANETWKAKGDTSGNVGGKTRIQLIIPAANQKSQDTNDDDTEKESGEITP